MSRLTSDGCRFILYSPIVRKKETGSIPVRHSSLCILQRLGRLAMRNYYGLDSSIYSC